MKTLLLDTDVFSFLFKGHPLAEAYRAFQVPTGILASSNSVAVADFNGDGRLDLAAASTYAPDNTLYVLLQVPTPTVTLSLTSLSFSAQVVGTTGAAQR